MIEIMLMMLNVDDVKGELRTLSMDKDQCLIVSPKTHTEVNHVAVFHCSVSFPTYLNCS